MSNIFLLRTVSKITSDIVLGEYSSINTILKKIFPNSNKKELKKYEKQILRIKDPDPILIITPNQAWVNKHGWNAYATVMDTFATYGLPPNEHRDKGSRCIFHFQNDEELHGIRDGIRINSPQNAFCIPSAIVANFPRGIPGLPGLQAEAVGTAWILNKVGARTGDCYEDKCFIVATYLSSPIFIGNF